jgi:ribose 5-phosphate isomerase B
MNKITIGVASDHAGFELKKVVTDYLSKKGYSFVDIGCDSNESCDYPDYAHPLGDYIEQGKYKLGIVLCGSGNGISMTINKHQGIRAAICWNSEIAELAVKHNDANVCSLPARYLNEKEAIDIVNIFLNSEFEGGRHKRRIDKIPVLPKKDS